jgi:hypothetical protein
VVVVAITDVIKMTNRSYYDPEYRRMRRSSTTIDNNNSGLSIQNPQTQDNLKDNVLPESDFKALKTWGVNEFKN